MQSIRKNKASSLPGLAGAVGYNRMWSLVLISPWVLGVILLKLAPIVASLVLSVTNFFLLEPQQTQFVGLENYVMFFNDPEVKGVLFQTISLALIIIPLQTCASIFLATVLSNKMLLMKNTMRSLFFLPSIIPSAAAIFMFQGFVNPSSGWLNRLILDPLGLGGLNQLYSPDSGQILFILTSLWAAGPGFLIIVSALQGIPPEIHEAAHMDGAGPIRHFLAITIPLVTPAIFFTLILNLTAVFGGAILLDRGTTFNTANSSYDEYVRYVLFDLFKLGYASSLAWVFFAFVMIVVLALFVTSKRWVYFPDER